MSAAISVQGLRKTYGAVQAVRGVDLEIEEGEIFSLLGPNGAGKTTTIEILEGHRPRDAGAVAVLGFDPGKSGNSFRERIGIVLQSTSVEPYLTVQESIELFRGYYLKPRPLGEILEVVGLTEQRDKRVRRLSGGQQRRLDVAIGLAGDPDLLFLDEPTTGFDPAARRQAWEMVRSLRSLGKTVLLTTHYMDEAEHLADRVAMMVEGRIVSEGTPAALADELGGSTISFSVRLEDVQSLPPLLEGLAGAAPNGTEVRMTSANPTADLHRLTGKALALNVSLRDLTVERPTLEDAYLLLAARQDVGSSPAETEEEEAPS